MFAFFTVNNITLKKGMRLRILRLKKPFFIAIWYIPVAYVGTIVEVEPVLTMIISSIFLKTEEKLTPLVIASGIVVFFGAGIIALTG